MSALSEQIRSFTNAHDRRDRERVEANMNEQFVNESDEKPRILIVDNNSKFARRVRLLLEQEAKNGRRVYEHRIPPKPTNSRG